MTSHTRTAPEALATRDHRTVRIFSAARPPLDIAEMSLLVESCLVDALLLLSSTTLLHETPLQQVTPLLDDTLVSEEMPLLHKTLLPAQTPFPMQ